MSMNPVMIKTALLLVCSNLFMTFAWYGHLKNLSSKPWWIAALISWGIALFEYLIQVPANRIGFQAMSLAQLKILQEVITLTVFVPFSILYMKEGFKLDFIWAGLCLVGAVYFMFRSLTGCFHESGKTAEVSFSGAGDPESRPERGLARR